jgi:hypothetical protein
VDINARIEAMRPWVSRDDWEGLQRAFGDACRGEAPDMAQRITAVDTRPYSASLRGLLAQVGTQLDGGVEAVYWEFDVDNSWESAVFLCRSYRPEAAGNDDWASDFDPDDVVQGPGMYELAELVRAWNGSDEDAAVNAYLVARTVAAFGDAAADWRADRPLCAGYHDQWSVFRIAAVSRDIPER